MKINKKLYIELLENELIYERTEHRATKTDLAIADKEINQLGKKLAEEIEIKDQYRRNIKYLKKDIWDMGKKIAELEEVEC